MDTQDSPRPRSPVLKRSVIVDGRKTSVSLENEFWTALKEIAASRGMTISALIGTIKHQGDSANLSSALRLVIPAWFRNRAEAAASDSSRKVLVADEDGSDDRGSAFRQ
jgi:predicted DNA-binding ribbon-helix-helix protein